MLGRGEPVVIRGLARRTGCLEGAGEYFAAGFFRARRATSLMRMAEGIRNHLTHVMLPAWDGDRLYPSGNCSLWEGGAAVHFHYSHSLRVNRERLREKLDREPDADTRDALRAMGDFFEDYYFTGQAIDPEYTLGGRGYTHSIPNIGKVLKHGLESLEVRIAEGERGVLEGEEYDEEFFAAMREVIEGVKVLHHRLVGALKVRDRTADGAGSRRRDLLRALKKVPLKPAGSFYEAVVATNVLYYLDGCDSLGRFDRDLAPHYARDLKEGRITEGEAVALVRNLWENIDATSGWNVALGGSDRDGKSAYSGLTRVCLRAARGMRRPNLALRVRKDMPDDVFDAALDTLATGCGLPALYGEESYLDALRSVNLNLHHCDVRDFAFAGCTETMIHGCSNVGSLDAGLNLLRVLSDTVQDHLRDADSFPALYGAYREGLEEAIAELVEGVNEDQRLKAIHQPQPLRSLLVDDCLEAGREFNAGGARYNWSVVNVGGLPNVVDSLAAIRELVFERGAVSAGELLAALEDNFVGHAGVLHAIEGCPRFGNDEEAVDSLAAELSGFVFREFLRYAPWRGGRFLPGCLLFVTYGGAGEGLPATPDGRPAGAPIADSAGPVQGRDTSGPTAMLKSVAALPQSLAPGTLVVNARFAKDHVDEGRGREGLKDLIRTYFRLGGLQIQINVVDQEVLREAIRDPQRHADLVVRVGGYSEYFNNLSDALKRSILERTEH